jgi:predicted HAD superfamily Cof-like phosphohydrolase
MLGCDHAIEAIQEILAKRADEAPVCEYPNLVEAIDGGADLLYVTFGMFDAFGVNAEPVFDIVHAANMTKVGAPRDANGKTMKPPGFVPPQERIRQYLLSKGAKL